MVWAEKRPKNSDANLKKVGTGWYVRLKVALPNGRLFDRDGQATSKGEARVIRDDLYKTYNVLSREILGQQEQEREEAAAGMTLRELAEKCRDDWWPTKGRSPEIAEQYFQKLRDYVYPVVGETKPIRDIQPEDWDQVLAHLLEQSTNRKKPFSQETIRKVKACFSSALSCAVVHKKLSLNPIKGLPYNPHPLAEADRMGIDIEELEDDGPDKRTLTVAEVAMLLRASEGTLLYPVVILQLGFGLRIAEALAVRWGDFDFLNGELRVRAQAKRRRNPAWQPEMADKRYAGSKVPKSILQRVGILKSKAGRRDIFVFPDAQDLLNSLPRGKDTDYVARSEEGGLLDPRNAQRMYRDLFVKAKLAPKKGEEAAWLGLSSPSSHSLRSWRLSHWANVVGLPESHLQRLAGHTRIETTMKYYVRSNRESLTLWLSQREGLRPAQSPLLPPAPPTPGPGGSARPR